MRNLDPTFILFGADHKMGVIASYVEGSTTALFDELMQDQTFKKILFENFSTKNTIDIAKKLIDYANKELI